MENNFFKKLVLGAAAVTTLSTAEAQSPIPKLGPDSLNVENTIVPKTLWANELVKEVYALGDLHEIRDEQDVVALERKYRSIIEDHLKKESVSYTPLDYGKLLEAYSKMNSVFEKMETAFPDADMESEPRIQMLKRLQQDLDQAISRRES